MTERTGIGARVRAARIARGDSLTEVAARVGRSKGWLSKVERGHLGLDSRRDLAALAEALHVSAAELTGQPYRETDGAPSGASHDAVPAIRRALLDDPPTMTGALAGYIAAADRMAELRRQHRLDEATPMAPVVIDGLRATAGDDPAGRRALAWTGFVVANILRELGYPDLGLHAASLLEAYSDDDPVLVAVAALTRSYGLSATSVGAYGAAARVADSAIGALSPVGPEQMAAAGQVRLASGFAHAASREPGEAEARFAEADELAARIEGSTEVGVGCGFGAPNVALHRLAAAVELGDPEIGVRIGSQVDPARIPHAGRRAAYWLDLGRAHAALGQDMQATAALRQGEEVAPLRVRLHPLAREAVARMVGRSHRATVDRELRGLAYRMGLPH